MKNKHCFLLLTLAGFCHVSKAQSLNGNSTQAARLNLAEVVSANLFSSGNGNGGPPANVELPLGGTNAMAEGIESPEITVTLQCTTDFDVSVSSSSENFEYSGPSTLNTVMPVSDVLSIAITNNATGGSIGNGFSQFQPIDVQGKQVISAGQRGVRTFGFKYKAQPGFNFPAGTYTTDIVYTISKK
ncbi:MAG: hypothetical protein K8F30_04340 [Taibaiella sp.]|nr:hypothetical protein [Taibaiella sp.]